MAEPMLQSLAERVLAAAVGTGLEAVFRTFAPAGEIVFAPQAFGGQRLSLIHISTPEAEQNEADYLKAYYFVEETKPVEEEAPAEEESPKQN